MGLTCWRKQRGEDQQARYPRLELHPKLVSPKDAFLQTGFSHQQRTETTEPNFCLALSSLSGTGSGEELLCQVTHIYLHIRIFPPHMNTLLTYIWKKKFSFLGFFFMSVGLFSGIFDVLSESKSEKS